jgi:hypothetical protein
MGDIQVQHLKRLSYVEDGVVLESFTKGTKGLRFATGVFSHSHRPYRSCC